MSKYSPCWPQQLLLVLVSAAVMMSCGEIVDELVDEPVVAQHEEPVIGGEDALPGEWPWQAQLSVPGYSHWCGGSLLNEEWVLTAAHCASGKSPADFTVRLGVHQLSAPDGWVQTRGVVDIEIAAYNPATGDNDIALLQLDAPVIFTSRVQPISVRTTDAPVGTAAFVTGWGNTAPGSGASDILQEAILPVEDTTTCNDAGTLSRTVTDTMVCAGYLTGEQGGCHGDSGGPLVISGGFSNGWELIGVVSWGVGYYCSSYTVFARLSTLAAWINSIAGPQGVYGDANQDGCVDQADYDLVVTNYGTPPAVDARADLNEDGVVDYYDVLTVVQNWGEGC